MTDNYNIKRWYGTMVKTAQFSSEFNLGPKWYHIGFASAPPIATIIGFVSYNDVQIFDAFTGGFIAGTLITAMLFAIILLAVIRGVSDWRPEDVELDEIPQSPFRFFVFVAIWLQLFDLGFSGGLLFIAFNFVIAITIGMDIIKLKQEGVDWGVEGALLVLGSLLFGFIGGLLYWYYRGRKRSTTTDIDSKPTQIDEKQEEAEV